MKLPVPSCPIARHLARVLVSSRAEQLPQAVSEHALRTFVNFMGCAVGGSRHEAVDVVERAMVPIEQGGRSRAIGRQRPIGKLAAAALNGMSGAVNAFDDTHAQAVIHPGSPVGAAVVALAASMSVSVRGEDLLKAYAWGVELACRLSKALSVAPAETSLAWSQTGVAAPVGAAAACAILLGLDEQPTEWALAIAAVQSCGIRVANGSMAMHLIPARAAASGLEAALLAEAGMSGPEHVFEGRYGHFDSFAGRVSPGYLVDDLGTRFELLANNFKPYPCGIVIHAVIDACLALSWVEGMCASRVQELVLEVPPQTAALADKPHPTDTFAAQVSVQHWAAAALLRGRAGLEEGSAPVIADDDVRLVRSKCRLVVRQDLEPDAAEVTVRLIDGRLSQVHINHCTGSSENPLTDQDLSRKFLAQATPVLGGSKAEQLLRRCWALPTDADVRSLWSGEDG